MPQDFSYQRDVAPYVANFFGEVRRDPKLSPEAMDRVQTSVLGGVQGVEAQRLKLKEEQDQNLLRNLSAKQTLLHLDDFRRRRDQEVREAEEVGAVGEEIRGIMSTDEPDYLKFQKLRDATLRNLGTAAANPNVGRMLSTAESLLPPPAKDPLTFAERIRLGMQGVPREILDTRDPDLIGQYAGAVAERQKFEEERERQVREAAEKNDRFRDSLLSKDIKYASNDDPVWMDDDSKVHARVIVDRWGTPEEKKIFFGPENNDHRRMDIVNRVKTRELTKRLTGASADPKADKKVVVAKKFGV